MNPLFNSYANVINNQRHPTRSSPMLQLVSLCIDNDYEPMLDKLDDDLLDDPSTYVFTMEGYVMEAVRAFLSSLGLQLRVDEAFKRPRDVELLLKGILLDIEEFEDYSTLQAIALSGEPFEMILENMLQYIHGEQGIQVVDMIECVEPRLVDVITNYLTMRVTEDEKSGFDYDAAIRLARYIRAYPDNPSVWAFSNASVEADLKELAESLTYPENYSEERLVEIYGVGLAITNTSDEKAALAKLEDCVAMVNSDELPTANILLNAAKTIEMVYLVATLNDEEENDE